MYEFPRGRMLVTMKFSKEPCMSFHIFQTYEPNFSLEIIIYFLKILENQMIFINSNIPKKISFKKNQIYCLIKNAKIQPPNAINLNNKTWFDLRDSKP